MINKKEDVQPKLHKLDLLFLGISIAILLISIMAQVNFHISFASDEEWLVYNNIASSSISDLIPAQEWPTRPLRWIPHIIVIHSAFDVLFNYNIYIVSLFILRGVFSFLILRELFSDQRYFVFMATILYLVYPVNRGYFVFNSINLQTSFVLGLITIYLFLMQWCIQKRWLWILILFLQICTLLTYELFYTVFGLCPIFLWWIDQKIHFSKKFWKTCLVWYSSYAILSLRMLYLIVSGKTGQYISNRRQRVPFREAFANSMQSLYEDHIISFVDGVKLIEPFSSEFYLSFLLALLISIFGLIVLQQNRSQDKSGGFQRHTILMMSALVFMGITFVIYVPISEAAAGYRVYFIPSLGATIIAISLLDIIKSNLPLRLRSSFLLTITTFLLTVGIHQAFFEMHYWQGKALENQQYLATIVETVPNPDEDVTIVVIADGRNRSNLTYFYERSDVFETVLSYVYKKPIQAWLCRHEKGYIDVCNLSADTIQLTTRDDEVKTLSYGDAVIFVIQDDKSITLLENINYLYSETDADYNPKRFISLEEAPSDIVQSYFYCWPITDCYATAPYQDRYRLDFDEFLPGTGWSYRSPSSESRWTIREYALLDFRLITEQTYLLEFEASALDPNVIDRVTLQISNTDIPLYSTDMGNSYLIQGILPADVISDTTTLAFHMVPPPLANQSMDNTSDMFGLNFDWLEIYPLDESIYQPQSEIHLEFDEIFLGDGWAKHNSNQSKRWTEGKYSSILVFLTPNQSYTLTFMAETVKPEIFDGLRFYANGVEINLAQINEGNRRQFIGTIPAEVVNSETTLLEITVEQNFIPAEEGINNDQRTLGLYFDWLEIVPNQ